MIPTSLQNTFPLFQIPKLISQQDQLLFLAQQTQQSLEQQMQNQHQQQEQQKNTQHNQLFLQQQIQQSYQQLQQPNKTKHNQAQITQFNQSQQKNNQQQQFMNNNQNVSSEQSIGIDLELFNQNLFYQAVFAGKELEVHLDSILKRKNKLENLIDYFSGFTMPNFIQLIGNITVSSLQRTIEQGDMTIINELIENPMKIILKENVWKLVTQIISKKLFSYENKVQDNYYKEISQMLIFKQEVNEMIFSFFADKQNNITLGCLNQFYQMLQSSSNSSIELQANKQANETQKQTISLQKSNEIYGNLSFQQYGGQIFQINRKKFQDLFEQSINLLASYFEKQNTIVSFIKRSSRQKLNLKENELLQNYLKLMGDFKSTNLKNFLINLCNDIFEQSQTIEKQNFINKISSLHQKTNTKIVFTLLEIIRIELDLIHQDEFLQFFIQNLNINQDNQNCEKQNAQHSSESSNYFLKTIDKLLNKCVFNGDEKCICKKCQCIRRNRNSAQESQKKKREALQQIGPLLEKQEILENRVKQKIQCLNKNKIQELESENTILKKLLTQMASQGSNYNNVQEIFQPIKEDEQDRTTHAISQPSKKICNEASKNLSSQPSLIESNNSISLSDINQNNTQS